MVEVDDAARSFSPFDGVFWLFCWRLSAPDNSERRLPGGLMDGAGPLVARARADPAWIMVAKARPGWLHSARWTWVALATADGQGESGLHPGVSSRGLLCMSCARAGPAPRRVVSFVPEPRLPMTRCALRRSCAYRSPCAVLRAAVRTREESEGKWNHTADLATKTAPSTWNAHFRRRPFVAARRGGAPRAHETHNKPRELTRMREDQHTG